MINNFNIGIPKQAGVPGFVLNAAGTTLGGALTGGALGAITGGISEGIYGDRSFRSGMGDGFRQGMKIGGAAGLISSLRYMPLLNKYNDKIQLASELGLLGAAGAGALLPFTRGIL